VKVDFKQVKKLREMTGAGIMDCRKALIVSQGDFNKAQKNLQKKGMKIASKKAHRNTGAGLIESYIHNGGQVGVLLKLSCETDFVSRNKDFKQLAHEIAMQIAAMNPKSVEELLKQEYIRDPKKIIADLIKEAIGKIKENIKISEIKRMEI